jgi:hypothetical protein
MTWVYVSAVSLSFWWPTKRAISAHVLPLTMEEADATVAQVVRLEDGDAGRTASASDRRPQAVGAGSGEEGRLRVAVLARREGRLDRIREHVRSSSPPRGF